MATTKAKSKRSGRSSREDRSLRRRVAFRTPRRTFLVFCEGTKTEPDYIEALRQEPAVRDLASVAIRIEASGAVPLTLVNAAAEARVRSFREHGEVDEVWCLFDVEQPRNHPDLDKAIERARGSNVRLAVSNPCFELWLALHFQDLAAWLSTDAAEKLRRKHDGGEGKGLKGALYMPRRSDAARRARSLTKKHEGDATVFPHDNPSSGMYRFLAAVESTE